MINIAMGEGVTAGAPAIVSAAGVGSCVVVALYDAKRALGGLAHIMLPDSAAVHHLIEAGGPRRNFRCADTAIAALIGELLARGSSRQDLVAKMAGGARMFSLYDNENPGVGCQNIRGVKHTLAGEGVRLVACDVGGRCGRTVEFHLATGKLVVKAFGQLDRLI